MNSNLVKAIENSFFPYLGVDLRWQRTLVKQDWVPLIPKSYPGISLFFGEKFCENMGMEFGYTETFQKTRSHSFNENERFFNSRNLNGSVLETKVKFHSVHFDINGYYPVMPCFDIIGSIGVGIMRPKFRVGVLNLGNISPTIGFLTTDAIALSSIKAKFRGIFRLGAGAEWLVSNCFGIRGMVRYETTSWNRLRGHYRGLRTSIDTTALKHPFKDSISISGGIFIKFL